MSITSILNDMGGENPLPSQRKVPQRLEPLAERFTRPVRQPRPPRQKYTDEEAYFIWYYRTDLRMPWNKVEEEFRRQWGQPRPKGGLQCKFYRLLEHWKVAKVREQTRQSQKLGEDIIAQFGLVQRTNLRFDWMQPDHFNQPQLPQFADAGSSCPGCEFCHGGT